jgi:DNA-binding response OmpR family regulator
MIEAKFEAYDLLFVEDEAAIRSNYVRYLKRYFRNVYEAENGEEAYKIYKDKKPKVMIVDINIPKLNGIDLVKKIRENDFNTKIIMLTAHSETHYLLQATELKLTKYLVKPVAREELTQALNLVYQELCKFDISSKEFIYFEENYRWDCEKQELLHFESTVTLTNKERKIVTLLLSKPGNTFSYDDIIRDVWYFSDEEKTDALKTIIKNLRKKLPDNTIKNVFGIGYKIETL